MPKNEPTCVSSVPAIPQHYTNAMNEFMVTSALPRNWTWNSLGANEPPTSSGYLLRWAKLLRGSLASDGESDLKLVPVGCGIPQPLFMLDPSYSHGRMTDFFTAQLQAATKQHAINLMHHVYKAAQTAGTRCQVLDTGVNDGYYALLAGAYGCSVRSVEPQKLCYEHLSLALGFNTIPGEVSLLHGAVGTTGTTLDIPRLEQCNGMFQATHAFSGPMKGNRPTGTYQVEHDTVKMYTAAALADPGSRVLLWRVDVKGAEVDVLNSGRELLLAGQVEHLILELVGQRWPGAGMTMENGYKILKEVLARYHCRELSTYKYMGSGAEFVDQFAKAGSDGEYWCFADESFRYAHLERLFPCLPHGGYSTAKKRILDAALSKSSKSKVRSKKLRGK